MADQDNILTKLHDLLLYVVPVLAKFARDHKSTLGDRIMQRLLDVQMMGTDDGDIEVMSVVTR